MGLYPGPYGGPRGGAVFCGRGTPGGPQNATGGPRACVSVLEVFGVLRVRSLLIMYMCTSPQQKTQITYRGASLFRRHTPPARPVQGVLEHQAYHAAGAYSKPMQISLGPPRERCGTLPWSKFCRPISEGLYGGPRRGRAPCERGNPPKAIRRVVGPTRALQVLASLTL